jgi:hypothetical protein
MNTIRLFSVLLFFGFIISCATIYDVDYDYDQKTNFSDLKRFDWMPVPDSTGADGFSFQRIQSAVDQELQAKGLMRTSEHPDFLIAPHVGRKDKVNVTDLGYAYGPHGRYWGGF